MTRFKHISKRRIRSAIPTRVILAAALFALAVSGVRAQGLAQVSLSGIPPVLPSPSVSEIAMQLRHGRFPLTFVYNSPDRQETAFRFRIVLEREGQVILDLTSDAVTYTRGVYTYTNLDSDPPITFPVGYQEVIEALGSGLDQDLQQTGRLSEGMYTLTVEAVPANPDELVIALPGSVMFAVQYLEPPLLLGPAQGEVVEGKLPVFSWLPVVGGPAGTVFDYEFLLVEVYPEQDPTQAIEANRPVEQETVSGMTTLPYTAQRLPLQTGSRYAWQVTARDAFGEVPFTDGGRSEIFTFTYAPGRVALAEWKYPFSDPAILFNLADADLTQDGYLVRGHYAGRSGAAPVSALFDEVLLDAATLDVLSGRVVLLGPLAEGVGALESDAAQHFLVDDTPPEEPFVGMRLRLGGAGEEMDVVIGPSEDPESGLRSVQYRLARQDETTSADSSWNVALETDEPVERFPGGTYEIDLSAEASDLLRQDRLTLQVRVVNGLGLESRVDTPVGTETDVSPPVVVQPMLTYTGYYHPERPNAVEVSDIVATDTESDILSVEYRIVAQDGEAGEWIVMARPEARTVRTGPALIQLPPAEADGSVTLEFRVTNAARLRARWSEEIDIDIDETEPVLAGTLADFVTSESDPRIEIRRDAVADYQSGLRGLDFRVIDDREPGRVYVDWTAFPPGPVAEVKRTQLNFTTSRAVRIEVRAENRARLEAQFAVALVVPELVIGDRTPPAAPAVTLRSVRSDADQVVLELRIGPTSDPETGISRIQYRIEAATSGSDLTGWVEVSGAQGAAFAGSTETIAVRPPRGTSSLRAVVRVVNGTGGANTARAQVSIAVEDTSPPVISSIQVYAQSGRILAFVDGMEDSQSSIDRVEYRLLGPGGSVVMDWTAYPIVPAGRTSYGRQLLRADIPAAAAGTTELTFQLRVTNGAGLTSVAEETVDLER